MTPMENGDEDEEDEVGSTAAEEPTGDSDLVVPYNRQYYHVPHAAVKRDHQRPHEVDSCEQLGEMAAANSPASKWPIPTTIDPACIVVLEGKIKEGDAAAQYVWYLRVAVKGRRSESDDMNILRHIPKGVVRDILQYMSKEPVLQGSSLITDYQPTNNNDKMLVPSAKVNNWTLVPSGQVPKTLGIKPKPAGQGGKEKREEREASDADAASVTTSEPAKKAKE